MITLIKPHHMPEFFVAHQHHQFHRILLYPKLGLPPPPAKIPSYPGDGVVQICYIVYYRTKTIEIKKLK